jgi:hypothetical protein
MSRLLTLFVAPLGALLADCDSCENQVVEKLTSPDRVRTAVLFQRDCGATTGFSTQVSIVRGDRLPNEPGNVFVADTDHGEAPTASWGGPHAELRWLDSTTLEVRYDFRAQTFQKVEALDGVSIRYVPLGAA